MTNQLKKAADQVTIKIPRPLYEKIALIIDGAGYNSVTDFVTYVLRDLIASHNLSNQQELSAENIAEVKKRLESLGYL